MITRSGELDVTWTRRFSIADSSFEKADDDSPKRQRFTGNLLARKCRDWKSRIPISNFWIRIYGPGETEALRDEFHIILKLNRVTRSLLRVSLYVVRSCYALSGDIKYSSNKYRCFAEKSVENFDRDDGRRCDSRY